MENNESNPKPQPTGGLKLMTVFVVVLALHVIVIGGMTTYYLLKGGSSDADLMTDKTHAKSTDGTVASDGQMPDNGTKNATPSTDGSSTPAPTPAPDQTASTDPGTSTPATSPAPANTVASAPVTIPPTPAPSTTPGIATTVSMTTPTTPEPAAPTPAPTGPVIDPPTSSVPLTSATADASAPAPEGMTYVVKSHDSLTRIAHRHHLTVAKLKAANSLNSDALQIGQKLIIPGQAPAATPSDVATADTEATSAPADADAKPVVATTKLAKKTQKADKMDKTAAAASDLHHHLYTVVKGDTLTKIAHKFKTTTNALMAANDITDPTKLSIGKKLKIPSKESRSAKNSEPAQSPANATAQSGAAKDATQSTADAAATGVKTQVKKAAPGSTQLANIAQ